MRLKQFNDIAEEFLQDLELNNRSPNTLKAYTTDIVDFSDYCIESKSMKFVWTEFELCIIFSGVKKKRLQHFIISNLCNKLLC